nr:uncharacterized protein LOC111415184 [Onthophagus taurus]
MEAAALAMQSTGTLEDLFNKVINGKTLHLNMDAVLPILSNDLRLNLGMVSPAMRCVLGEALCFFMTRWPGWCTADIKDPSLKNECFEKYQRYLRAKLTFILMNQRLFRNHAQFTKRETSSEETQMDSASGSQEVSPSFNVVLGEPPNVLSGLIVAVENDDIVIKMHTEKPWNPLKLTSMASFLNHPYVKYTINLPNVQLSRSNLHEFKRYLVDTEYIDIYSTAFFNSECTKICPHTEPKVYSYNFMLYYFKQLTSIMAQYVVKNHELIQSVLMGYLQDIQDCNLQGGTMASPFNVTFNIGGKIYSRSRKIEDSSTKTEVTFLEILIPRVDFSLTEFNVEEAKRTRKPSFVDLNRIHKLPRKQRQTILCTFANCLTLSCTLCKKDFQGESCDADCLEHFQSCHKGEEPVKCAICQQVFDVMNLAAARWRHDCQIPQKSSQSDSNTGGGGSSLGDMAHKMKHCNINTN